MLQFVSEKPKDGKTYTLYLDVSRLKYVLDIDGTKSDITKEEWLKLWQ